PLFLFQVLVPLTDGLDPILMLTDDATVAAWYNQSLPKNRKSIENATMLTTGGRWPLVTEPPQQGIQWIRNRLGTDLRVVLLRQGGTLTWLSFCRLKWRTVTQTTGCSSLEEWQQHLRHMDSPEAHWKTTS
ncbi:unnamed protein product, partial [Tetraodon nigroviridis]